MAAAAHLCGEVGESLVDHVRFDIAASRDIGVGPGGRASGLLGDDREVGQAGDAELKRDGRRVLHREKGLLRSIELLDCGFSGLTAEEWPQRRQLFGAVAPDGPIDARSAGLVLAHENGGHAEADDESEKDEHLSRCEVHRLRRYRHAERHPGSARR